MLRRFPFNPHARLKLAAAKKRIVIRAKLFYKKDITIPASELAIMVMSFFDKARVRGQ